MTRKRIRENIFTLLFRNDFYNGQGMEEQTSFFAEDMEDIQEQLALEPGEIESPREKDIAYITATVADIREHMEDIDATIASHAEGWKLSRIAKAELTILRLGTYELYYDEAVPAKVAINEAVELAKKYGGEKTPGFVNAILGKIHRSMEEDHGSVSVTD